MNIRYLWWTNGILLLLAVAPILLFILGLGLNVLFGCDIRDEGGAVHGDCTAWQSELVYSLLMMMWLTLMSIPAFGSLLAISLVITIIISVRQWLKSR